MLKKVFIMLSALLMISCATIPENQRHPADPWEGFNRQVFKFNDGLDKFVVKPVTKGYQKVTPDVVESGVSNFFANLTELGNALNNFLQGEPVRAVSDVGRFILNTTFGIAGVFDVATPMGLQKNIEDLGQTMAVWGVPSGPYLMLPFWGPSTLRDTGGMVGDFYTHYPWRYLSDEVLKNSLTVAAFIDQRSILLYKEELLASSLYDPYASMRDVWLQHRQSRITNGQLTAEQQQEEDDLIKELEALD